MRDDVAGSFLARALIGRDAELEELRRAWRDGGTIRFVSGVAGIGKSRLARALTSWALAAAASDSALVLGEDVLRLLTSAAADRGTATLVVEDLHWSDPETLAVLEYLADNLADTPVFAVATVRDGVAGPGTELAASLVDRRVAVAVLHPLSADGVLIVARACLGGVPLPSDVATTLVIRSEGVPFLVEELVATGARSGWDTVDAEVRHDMERTRARHAALGSSSPRAAVTSSSCSPNRRRRASLSADVDRLDGGNRLRVSGGDHLERVSSRLATSAQVSRPFAAAVSILMCWPRVVNVSTWRRRWSIEQYRSARPQKSSMRWFPRRAGSHSTAPAMSSGTPSTIVNWSGRWQVRQSVWATASRRSAAGMPIESNAHHVW